MYFIEYLLFNLSIGILSNTSPAICIYQTLFRRSIIVFYQTPFPAINHNLSNTFRAIITLKLIYTYLVSMKFFVQLVSCCGCSSKRADRAAEEEEILVPAAAVESSDMNNTIMYKRRRRRRRGSARSAGSLPEWKPSLSSISEDVDHAPAANSGRNLKKKKVVIAASRPINQLRRRLKSRFSRIACLAAMVPAPFLI